MTLHDAIIKVLEINNRSMTVNKICEQLNLNKSYQKKNGSQLSSLQVHGRTKNYTRLFKRNKQEVSLDVTYKALTKEAVRSQRTTTASKGESTLFNTNVFERYLLNDIYFKSATLIDNLIPINKPGIYCIKIDSSNSMPEPFGKTLNDRSQNILYIGIAEKCLKTRLLNQELRIKGHGTFIRSIGAILGYKPAKGSLSNKKNQRNYTFSAADNKEIITWINQHLLVNWIEYDGELKKMEEALIKKTLPLLNISKNKFASAELKELRAECLKLARLKSI